MAGGRTTDAGCISVCAVFRVLFIYACILLVHSLLYWGRRMLRARNARSVPLS